MLTEFLTLALVGRIRIRLFPLSVFGEVYSTVCFGKKAQNKTDFINFYQMIDVCDYGQDIQFYYPRKATQEVLPYFLSICIKMVNKSS